MFDLPLHPIAVHIPITLGLLIPLLGAITLWGIKKGLVSSKSWLLLVVISAIYFASSLLAVELGERDEDLVEQVVKESAIEAHEEAGEKVPWAAGIVLFAFAVPLVTGKKTKFQLVALAVSILGTIPLIRAGHTGGELVYKYGAAQAHIKDKAVIQKSNDFTSETEEIEDEDD